ncbi:hypothetical protein I7G59_04690 [Sinorhizobium meliloti]|uniref:hypothetical protein n=1 Tax=Rhizobium meliloti TaxID=382 RepID=UPI002380177C|nr:hypothetical protein [Sinorhizobium meliloti]MDE3796625.1 hypothetical protein [Sinorhizobium meliloti]
MSNSEEIKARRRELERRIEELVALLDFIDGDADFEPALGWPLSGPRALSQAAFNDDDRERDDEREWDQAEDGIADADGLAEQWPNLAPHRFH